MRWALDCSNGQGGTAHGRPIVRTDRRSSGAVVHARCRPRPGDGGARSHALRCSVPDPARAQLEPPVSFVVGATRWRGPRRRSQSRATRSAYQVNTDWTSRPSSRSTPGSASATVACGVVLGVQRFQGDVPPGEVEPRGEGASGLSRLRLWAMASCPRTSPQQCSASGIEDVLPIGVVPRCSTDVLHIDGHGLFTKCALLGPSAHRAVEQRSRVARILCKVVTVGAVIRCRLPRLYVGANPPAASRSWVNAWANPAKVRLAVVSANLATAAMPRCSATGSVARDGCETPHRAQPLDQAAKAIGRQRHRLAYALPMWGIVEGTQLLATRRAPGFPRRSPWAELRGGQVTRSPGVAGKATFDAASG